MLMELGAASLFGERVTDIVGGANVAEDNLCVEDPFWDCELLEFNMAGASGVCH